MTDSSRDSIPGKDLAARAQWDAGDLEVRWFVGSEKKRREERKRRSGMRRRQRAYHNVGRKSYITCGRASNVGLLGQEQSMAHRLTIVDWRG